MKKRFSLLSMLLVFIFMIGLVGCKPAETPTTSESVGEPAALTKEPAAQ